MIFELNKFLTASKFAGLLMMAGLFAFKALRQVNVQLISSFYCKAYQIHSYTRNTGD